VFQVEHNVQCSYDWVKVFDSNGTLLKHVCGVLSQDLVLAVTLQGCKGWGAKLGSFVFHLFALSLSFLSFIFIFINPLLRCGYFLQKNRSKHCFQKALFAENGRSLLKIHSYIVVIKLTAGLLFNTSKRPIYKLFINEKNLQVVKSIGTHLTVQFYTDGVVENKGFLASW
jgi:hypothetical protein